MPPKRPQTAAGPDEAPKRARVSAPEDTAGLSPMSELEELPDVTHDARAQERQDESAGPSDVTVSTGHPPVALTSTPTRSGTADVAPAVSSHGASVTVAENTESAVVDAPSRTSAPAPTPTEVEVRNICETTTKPAVINEAVAVQILKQLGVEPGAVVGADANTLGVLIGSLLQHKADLDSAVQADASLAAALAAAAVPPAPADAVAAAAAQLPVNPVVHTPTAAPVAIATPSPMGAVLNPADDPAITAAALSSLTQLGVPANRLSGWSAAEMRRLDMLLRWTDPARSVYNIANAPNKKDWGQPAAFNDTSNTLCAEGSAKPLTFWITGEVSVQYWFDNEGFPAQRPAFAIQPMVESQAAMAKGWLHELCMPTNSSKVAEQMGPGQVKASRWMNERGKKGQPAKTHEFKAVYDARKTLRDKSLLQQLNVGQLQLHDVVVMEVRINRYATKDEATPDAKGKRRAMDRWQAYFDLQAVYKIKDAVETPEVSVPAADFSI